MIESLTVSLVFAITIELSISLIVGIRKRNDIMTIIATNTLTNPTFVFILNILKIINMNYFLWIIVFLVMEIIIVFIEGKIYDKILYFNKISGLKLSFINNIASFIIGLLFTTLI